MSLGKVEAALKVSPVVENMCVYADSSKNNIVAIVSPVQKNLEDMAQGIGKQDLRREKLCLDDDVNKAILEELLSTGKKGGSRQKKRSSCGNSQLTGIVDAKNL